MSFFDTLSHSYREASQRGIGMPRDSVQRYYVTKVMPAIRAAADHGFDGLFIPYHDDVDALGQLLIDDNLKLGVLEPKRIVVFGWGEPIESPRFVGQIMKDPEMVNKTDDHFVPVPPQTSE